MISKIVLCMHNVEVFVNYDPPCNSVFTARRLNKRSSSKKLKDWHIKEYLFGKKKSYILRYGPEMSVEGKDARLLL